MYRSKLNEKLQESLAAVLPILAIVLILSFTIAPLPTSVLMAFLFGAVLLVVGMMFFSLGAELAMSPMGERVGACITKTRRVGIMLTLGFLLGFLITISEPDLQVLANQVQAVPNMVLIVTVAVGVGLFLCFAMLRMLLSVPLNTMLVGFYIVVFVLAMFVPKDFLAVAFDSGGVTTGPMTVPFIMAMGVGVSAIRSDKHSANDSFGLVAGLTEHLTSDNDNGVGGDIQIVVGHRRPISVGFKARQIQRHFVCLKIVRIILVDFERLHDMERNVEHRKKLAPSRRTAG